MLIQKIESDTLLTIRTDAKSPIKSTDVIEVKGLKMGAFLVFALTLTIAPVMAQDRMQIIGNTLIFDTRVLSSDAETNSILRSDANLFGDLIMNYPSIDTVIISSKGGDLKASYDIAKTITTFGISVIARGDCESGCTIVFLGGKYRKLEQGARLGFHRSSTEAYDHSVYYEGFKDKMGWKNEFAYATWVYEDGQIVARNFIQYLLRRGVSIDFALSALSTPADHMWYPPTDELFDSGVITVLE
jgi:hypothetical protein